MSDHSTQPLRFGTAGLRAPIGPGDDHMNVSTVTRTTAGVAQWLADNHDDGTIRVAVGYDTRYGSHAMALATAQVFAGAGFEVTMIDEPSPTPVLAWIVRDRGLHAGVQITASHNPASDNGYKLYLEGGSQLLSPADREIEQYIAQQPHAHKIPRVDAINTDHSVITGYINAIVAKVAKGSSDLAQRRRDVRIAYTPLHGVGGSVLESALRQAGFSDIHPVEQQRWPDPDFPTVNFPNPEEPGACDALVELGCAVDADVLIALDPDADRCAVGTRHGMLRGDQTGPLLATRILDHYCLGDEEAPVVATTVVSSQMLGAIAADRGWDYQETLTGFKHLARAADGRPGRLAFAYEEAIGTCPFPELVADKDGIATALVTAVWVAELKSAGQDLDGVWRHLENRYGRHRTAQVSARFDSSAQAAEAAERFRAHPPRQLAGMRWHTQDTDYGVVLTGDRDCYQARVVCRPSGTEAKVKFYVEVRGRGEGVEEMMGKIVAELGRTF